MAKKRYIPNVVNPVFASGKHWESCEYNPKKDHNGEDLISRGPDDKYASVSDVIAIASGIVTYVGKSKTRGNYVTIRHDNGKYSRYVHLADKSIKVKKNQLVSKGQLIGTEGDSGAAEGIHLHLAVFNIVAGIEVYEDPYDYLIGNKTFDNEWDAGLYVTLKSKYLRTSPEVKTNNKIKYNGLLKEVKVKCTKDVQGYAKWKVNEELELVEFVSDKKGNLWGRRPGVNTDTWLCVRDNTGNQVAKK